MSYSQAMNMRNEQRRKAAEAGGIKFACMTFGDNHSFEDVETENSSVAT